MHCITPPSPRPNTIKTPLNASRMGSIIANDKLWSRGKEITYSFMRSIGNPSKGDREQVRLAFATWEKHKIGITFREVSDPAEAICRIAFVKGFGFWSYVGTDNLYVTSDSITMNFGETMYNNAYLSNTETLHIIMHEIGHLLGFKHQHQNGNDPIEWNERNVIKQYSSPPNRWNEQTIRDNILNVEQSVLYPDKLDIDSIMMYEFSRDLIEKPEILKNGYKPKLLPSETDIQVLRENYVVPKNILHTIQARRAQKIIMKTGQEIHLKLEIPRSKHYRFRTFGKADTYCELMVERPSGEQSMIAFDDNSGVEDNIYFRRYLYRSSDYIIKLKCLYSDKESENVTIIYY